MPLKAVVYLVLVALGLGATMSAPFNGILTFVSVTYIRPEVMSYGVLAQYRLPFVISAALLIATLLKCKFRMIRPENNSTLYFLLLMSCFMVLSSRDAVRPLEGGYWSWYMVRTVLFCYLVVMLTDTREKFYRLVQVNVLAGGFLIVWAFQQHFRGNERLEDVGGGGTGTSNGFAALLLLMLSYIMTLFGSDRRKNLLFMLLMGVTLMDVVFTQSRSALVGLLVMAAYLFYCYPAKHKVLAGSLLLVLFIVAASTTTLGDESYLDRVSNMFVHKMEVDSSASSRKHLWNAALQVFGANKMLGVGQQQFKYHARDYSELHKNTIADAHNTYLLVLAEGGMLTFACYLAALVSFFVYSFRLRRIARERGEMEWLFKTVICFEAGMVGFLTCGLAHSYVTMEYYYWMLVVPCILLNIVRKEKEQLAGQAPAA